MRLLELFAGTGSVGKSFLKYKWKVVGLDLEKGHEIQCDILTWDYKKYPVGYFDAIHASPPCIQYSIARTSAKTPRDFVSADKLVRKTLEIIRYFHPTVWIIENPYTGYLRKRPCMKDMARFLRVVCYCKYGKPYKKATAIWTNLGTYWEERPMCNTETPCEFVRNGRHAKSAQYTSGYTTEDLNALPKALCDDLAKATTQACKER
jgi:hypothetical protein